MCCGASLSTALALLAVIRPIFALSAERQLDSQNGFQNAVYADFTRTNLLQIENSFQIQRCDRATLFLARQYERSHHPDAPPLAYKGHGFSQICRSIFLQELRYNAYRIVSQAPQVYWMALNGLMVPGAFETQDYRQLRPGPIALVVVDLRSSPRSDFRVASLVFFARPFGRNDTLARRLSMGRRHGGSRPQAAILGGLTVLHRGAVAGAARAEALRHSVIAADRAGWRRHLDAVDSLQAGELEADHRKDSRLLDADWDCGRSNDRLGVRRGAAHVSYEVSIRSSGNI